MSSDNRSYRVIVSSKAREMLLAHVAFLARVSDSAVDKLIDEYQDAVNRLDRNPERFPFLDSDGLPPRTYRKCLFARRYELIFMIDKNLVFVDAGWDCRQNPSEQ